jgi:hypothetical protein
MRLEMREALVRPTPLAWEVAASPVVGLEELSSPDRVVSLAMVKASDSVPATRAVVAAAEESADPETRTGVAAAAAVAPVVPRAVRALPTG